jgi:hypothetical protein
MIPSSTPQVAPLPPGALVPLSELAYKGNIRPASRLRDEVKAGNAPALPYVHRIGGQEMVTADAAASWLDDLVRYRMTEPERRARAQAEAKERHEREQRERHEREQRQYAEGRARVQFFRDAEAKHAEGMASAERTGVAIVVDANGRVR